MLLNCGVGEHSWECLPLDCKEIQPVHPKGNQSWIFIGIFIGKTHAEAEVPILWPPDKKNWFFGKDPDAGKDWGQEEKGTTEDEMVGWHHWLDAHEFEQALGIGDGQGGLACHSPWGRKESDKWLSDWTDWTYRSHLHTEFSWEEYSSLCLYWCVYPWLKRNLCSIVSMDLSYWHQVRLGVNGIWVINKYQCYVYNYIFSYRFLAHFFEAWF